MLSEMSMSLLISEDELEIITKRYSLPANQLPKWSSLSATVLNSVIQTAASPEISGRHTSHAVSTLYSILQSQKDGAFKTVLWEQGVWLQCFEVYLSKL